VSAFIYDRFIEEALSAGARGFMSKSPDMSVLVDGITSVSRGELFFCDESKERLIVEGESVSFRTAVSPRVSSLTPREREILRYLARGKPKREIGEILDISVKTVDKHSENLMRKLAVNNRVQLTRLAIREGLSDL
jgi:DNA-binding NarL/FixJ family response regulator